MLVGMPATLVKLPSSRKPFRGPREYREMLVILNLELSFGHLDRVRSPCLPRGERGGIVTLEG